MNFENIELGKTYAINSDKPLGAQLREGDKVKVEAHAETLFSGDEPNLRVKSVEKDAMDVLWTVRAEDLDELASEA